MKLKTNLPFSMWEYKISGVYKITFDDGTFYIGCSNHIRSRASVWESIFRTQKGIPGVTIGTAMLNKIKEGITASLDIVELCAVLDLKDKEAVYLNKYKENSMMLSSYDIGSWKPVLQHTKYGVFVKKHISLGAASKYNNCRISNIQKVLRGERNSLHDMIFSYENDYHIKNKRFVRKLVERKGNKSIAVLNDNGETVKVFKYAKAASEFVGCHVSCVNRVMRGVQKTANGYFFKYI